MKKIILILISLILLSGCNKKEFNDDFISDYQFFKKIYGFYRNEDDNNELDLAFFDFGGHLYVDAYFGNGKFGGAEAEVVEKIDENTYKLLFKFFNADDDCESYYEEVIYEIKLYKDKMELNYISGNTKLDKSYKMLLIEEVKPFTYIYTKDKIEESENNVYYNFVGTWNYEDSYLIAGLNNQVGWFKVDRENKPDILYKGNYHINKDSEFVFLGNRLGFGLIQQYFNHHFKFNNSNQELNINNHLYEKTVGNIKSGVYSLEINGFENKLFIKNNEVLNFSFNGYGLNISGEIMYVGNNYYELIDTNGNILISLIYAKEGLYVVFAEEYSEYDGLYDYDSF